MSVAAPEQLTGAHLYLDIAKSGYLFHGFSGGKFHKLEHALKSNLMQCAETFMKSLTKMLQKYASIWPSWSAYTCTSEKQILHLTNITSPETLMHKFSLPLTT